MNLVEITASYLQQFPHGSVPDIRKQERALERFGQVAFGGFAIAILAGISAIIYLIVTRMILSGENFWFGVLLTFFIVFAALSLAYVFLQESLNEKKSKLGARASSPAASEARVPEQLGQPVFQPAASVVEDTTELLHAENKSRKHT